MLDFNNTRVIGKFLATFCTLSSKILNWGVQSSAAVSNHPHERALSNSDNACQLLIFLIMIMPLMKPSVTEFSRVLGSRLRPCVLIKKWLHQRQFLEVLGDEIILAKSLWWILVLATNLNISKNKLVHTCCLSGYCEKYNV